MNFACSEPNCYSYLCLLYIDVNDTNCVIWELHVQKFIPECLLCNDIMQMSVWAKYRPSAIFLSLMDMCKIIDNYPPPPNKMLKQIIVHIHSVVLRFFSLFFFNTDSKSWRVFGRRAEAVSQELCLAFPDIFVEVNLEKPRRNSFEVVLLKKDGTSELLCCLWEWDGWDCVGFAISMLTIA